MLKALIVDDELKSRESLSVILSDFFEGIDVVAMCQNVSEAKLQIRQHRPDVIFLDIQMQRETGFDLLMSLEHIDFEVIFTTAHSEYAIKAFKFSAIDYLLKPIDINDLTEAINKVRQRRKSDIAVRLEQLFHNLKPAQSQQYKIGLPAGDGLVFVKAEDILYCEADSNYTKIFCRDGSKYVVSRTLKEYDELLSEHDFFRIHNSYLINLNCIKKYIRGEGGQVIMNNDTTLDVSKRRKEAFLSRLRL